MAKALKPPAKKSNDPESKLRLRKKRFFQFEIDEEILVQTESMTPHELNSLAAVYQTWAFQCSALARGMVKAESIAKKSLKAYLMVGQN